MDSETQEPVTIADLVRIFIRVQDTSGRWINVDCHEATDAQFDTWIRGRIIVQGGLESWPLQERADVCDLLWQAGTLVMLRKNAEREE